MKFLARALDVDTNGLDTCRVAEQDNGGQLSFHFVHLGPDTRICHFCNTAEVSSDFLVAQPSFVHGLSRMFGVFSPSEEYNYSISDDVADAYAIYSDWNIVGHDLCRAIRTIDTKNIIGTIRR